MNENFAVDPDANFGNVVIVEHPNEEFSSYVHLKRGSVRVKVGDKVEAGTVLGQVGQSGNSLTPHLHFQVSNKDGRSLPVQFGNVKSLEGKKMQHMLKTGEFFSAE